jgi:cell division protein FtsA
MENNHNRMEEKYVAAIDVGTTKIVTLIGKRNENNKLEVVGFSRSDSKGIRRGEVLNQEQAALVVKKTVADLQRKTTVRISEVFVGVVGQHIRIQKNRANIIRSRSDECISRADVDRLKKDVGNITLKQGEEILHIIPLDFYVDGEVENTVFNPVGMLGKKLDGNFNIVVGNIDSLQKIRRCIQQAELETRDIILEPLASADAVLYDVERETGVALVDIGGGTTDVAIFHDNVLRHSAVIPCGGNIVTCDIKTACGITEQVAEEVKVQYGMALSDQSDEQKVVVIPPSVPGRQPKEITFALLSKIIQARMDEIIDAVLFHIENSGCADKLGSGVVITGGGAMLKHLVPLFQFKTGKEVRIGYPDAHLAGNAEPLNDPSYATGVGLLMKGFECMDEKGWEPMVLPHIEKEKESIPEKPVSHSPTAGTSGGIINRFKKIMDEYFDDPGAKM